MSCNARTYKTLKIYSINTNVTTTTTTCQITISYPLRGKSKGIFFFYPILYLLYLKCYASLYVFIGMYKQSPFMTLLDKIFA